MIIEMVAQYLPRLLIAVILEELSTVSFERRCVNDLNHASNTLLHGNGGFLDPESVSTPVTELSLNPAILRCYSQSTTQEYSGC